MTRSSITHLIRLISSCCVLFCCTVFAEEWQPFCIEGSSCEFPYKVALGGGLYGYSPMDRFAAGPLVTEEGILLHHSPPQLDARKRHVFLLSPTGLTDFGDSFGLVSDVNSVQAQSGKTFSFWIGGDRKSVV